MVSVAGWVDCTRPAGGNNRACAGILAFHPRSIPMPFNELTPDEIRVIVHRGTEAPYTGRFYRHKAGGTYVCRRCETPLYRSVDKFESGCGWPSFDDEVPGAVERRPDADGHRVEIVCASCGGHLGHVFEGERFTPKDVRHCVNSVSLDFRPADTK